MPAADYRLDRFLSRKTGCVVPLWSCDGEFIGYTLAPTSAQFLREKAFCAGCAAPVIDFASHEQCPNLYWWAKEAKLIVEVSLLHQRDFDLLLRRESARRKQFKRNRLLLQAGGRHSLEQIRTLFGLQEGRCYYCFVSLVTDTGRPSFHRDHFEPIEGGGTNSIRNIVLTCAKCNISKSTSDGEFFKRCSMRIAPLAVKAELRRIQRAVAKHNF